MSDTHGSFKTYQRMVYSCTDALFRHTLSCDRDAANAVLCRAAVNSMGLLGNGRCIEWFHKGC